MQKNRPKLRSKREGRGLTPEEIAAKVGVSISTYRRWERGDYHPQFKWKQKLSTLFECSIEDLF
jgi:DNA-binding XRE family transcriptional regulator